MEWPVHCQLANFECTVHCGCVKQKRQNVKLQEFIFSCRSHQGDRGFKNRSDIRQCQPVQ